MECHFVASRGIGRFHKGRRCNVELINSERGAKKPVGSKTWRLSAVDLRRRESGIFPKRVLTASARQQKDLRPVRRIDLCLFEGVITVAIAWQRLRRTGRYLNAHTPKGGRFTILQALMLSQRISLKNGPLKIYSYIQYHKLTCKNI